MTEFKDNLEQMEKIESPPDEDEQGKLLEYALCELEACAWSGAREQVREFDMKRNVFYHPGHCWVKKENGTLVVGIDDFARRLLGSVDEVILPEENKMVFCGEPGITFRCGDRIAEMLSPVTGIVTRVNGRLKEKPGLVCEDSYRRGWLFTVTPKDLKREVREYLYGYDARKWLESDAEELHEDIGEDLGATMADGGVLTGDFSSRVGKEDWERITRRFFRTQR
jgi:glycine cleavage system H protein